MEDPAPQFEHSSLVGGSEPCQNGAVGVAAEPNTNERTVVERRDPLLGGVFDRRFRIEGKIAAGGFGAIYRATHLKSGHEFALKVLHPNLTNDPRVVARFQREGAALTRLRDPHTITAYELGEAPDGTLYIVMELLRGESLYERYRVRGALPWRRVITIARAVCSSLAEAHTLGIIHRDLKPTNIHLEPRDTGEDFVKVLDFGIAKILQGSEIDSAELTHAGQMIGTLDYMSPEQMVGGMCAPSSDIYTLGVVMYEMIAGRKPYDDANSAASALAAVLTTTPDRLSTRLILPTDVDRIVMRCLERQYADRFQTATELAAAIDEILSAGDDAVTSVAPSARKPTSGPLPTPSIVKPAPVAPRRTPLSAIPAPARPSPTPAGSEPGPIDFDSTLIGHHPVTHLPATIQRPSGAPLVTTPRGTTPLATSALGTTPPVNASPGTTPPVAAPLITAPLNGTPLNGTPLNGNVGMPLAAAPLNGNAGTPLVPTSNLRAAYPKIHLQPASPTRPQPSVFDDRPASSVDVVAPLDTMQRVRREAAFRRLALVAGLVISFIVGILLASQL
jgi:serine/threonine-protein kinase